MTYFNKTAEKDNLLKLMIKVTRMVVLHTKLLWNNNENKSRKLVERY